MGRVVSLSLIVVLTLAVAAALGQDTVGSRIIGTVTDPSGTVVPNATVKITSPDTGYSRTVQTGSDGVYIAPQIVAGKYSIEATAPGFSTAHVTGVVVTVNANVRQDIRLEIGAVATRVEVSGEAALVNSYTAELAQTVNTRQLIELPLNARDVTSLAMLVAGTTDPVTTSFYASSSGFAATAPSVNGGKIQDNSYYLDGVSNLYSQRLSSNMYPNPDAIEEFTMNTAQYSAEFGGRPGGQLSARTKSGTNALHGSLFEFVRNPKFNARSWADTRGVNDGIKRNQYGWAVGGPVYLPKIFDGRNKLFWFNSFQNIPFRSIGSPGFHQSWTAAEKQGDFSARLKGSTRQVPSPACDGTMLTVDTGAIFDPRTANSRCGSLGNPFSGNIIPSSMFDPVAVKLMRDHTPDAAFPGQQIPFFTPAKYNEYQFIQKVDFNLADRHALMVRYIKGRNNGSAYLDPKDIFSSSGINSFGTDSRSESIAATETWTATPRLVINTGFVYIKNPWSRIPSPVLIGPDQLGSRLTSDPECRDWQGNSIAGFGSFSVVDRCGVRQNRNWEYNASGKYVLGRHEIGAGGSYGGWAVDDPLLNGRKAFGSFNFTGGFTGLSAADFLIGRAETYTQPDFGPLVISKRTVASMYVTDNLRVTRKLTINLGLRWEPALATRRIDTDNLAWYYPGQKSQRFTNAPVGILYGGDPGTPGNANFFARYNQLAPRFGFALDPTGSGKWSIRGGIGSYFGIIGGGNSLELAGRTIPPMAGATYQAVNPPNMVWPWDTPTYGGKEPVPTPPPTADSPVRTPFGGALYDPRTKAPNTWQYSLTIERMLTESLVVRAGYVGTKGVHNQDGYNTNLAVFIPGASTAANQQQRRPDPNFTSFHIAGGYGFSRYSAFQLTIDKRYSRGISMLTSYTYSRSIDTHSGNIGIAGSWGTQDPRGSWYNKGLSDFDRTHVLSVSPVWDLPTLSSQHPAMRLALGGWQISTILQLRSGYMMTPTASGNRCLCGPNAGTSRADTTGVDWKITDRDRPDYKAIGYFNQTAFRNAELGTLGTAGRNIIRGPGFANMDLMIGKQFQIREGMRVQFRSEYFNVTNRVNLGAPILDVNNANFGKILTTATDPRILQFGLKFQF
jgi:hypothetical protein